MGNTHSAARRERKILSLLFHPETDLMVFYRVVLYNQTAQ